MIVTHIANYGWALVTQETLTDEAAQAITFNAFPKDVVLGEFVEISDADGIRIGHVKTAEYVECLNGPDYVTVGIELR